jgi:membrane-bound metal-dependent hydrolase YbcI (DUF457 family)
MKRGHKAATAPFAIGYGYVAAVTEWVHPLVAVAGAGTIMLFCTFPDYDHPRFRGKRNPIAAAVRNSAKLLYLIRTSHDREREDQHRGPSHCIEWNLAVGALLMAPVPVLGGSWSLYTFLALAVALGGITHILGDLMTPSGVPLSVTWNVLAYRGAERQVWRRHALGWFVTDSAGERVGAIPALYALSAIELGAMVGALGPIWSVTTGDVFDGRWVVLLMCTVVGVGAAWALLRLALGGLALLGEYGLVGGAVATVVIAPALLWGAAFAVGALAVLGALSTLAPTWLPW